MELKEGYEEINELEKLSIQIVQFFADKNTDFIKRIINGLNSEAYFNYEGEFLYDIIPDKSIFPKLKDFIDQTDIKIKFVGKFGASGVFIPNRRNSGGEIWLRIVDYNEFVDEIEYGIGYYKLKEEWTDEKAKQLLRISLGSAIRKVLIHELQHAFDDFRSNGKYARDKKSNNYFKSLSYNALSPNSVMDNETRKIYLTLPHEYWARFSEYVTSAYLGGDFEDTLDDFKLFFSGFKLLSDNNKNRLTKALYKFWDEKRKNKKVKENIMIVNKEQLSEMVHNIYEKINKSKDDNKKLTPFLQKLKDLLIGENFKGTLNTFGSHNNIKNWPDITYGEGGENPEKIKDGKNLETQALDLENFEFLDLTNDKLVFYAGGDWQYPYTVTVKLVGGDLKVVDFHPYNSKKDGKTMSHKEIIKILDAEDIVEENEEKEAKEKANMYIEKTKEMDFWKNNDVNEILTGIKNYNEYIRPWGLVSKYIKEYVKNNNNIKENTMKLNKEQLSEMLKKITKTLIKEDNRNVKTVNLILTDVGVKMFRTIPTFKNLLAPNQLNNLIVGDNIINVNHYIYSKLIQVTGYDQANMSVSEITGNEQPIEESTYELDSTDPQLQTKSAKLQSDPTLFNKDTDKIEISNQNESILVTKNQIMKMMVEAKVVRDKNGDYVKAIKKADRETEMDAKGPGFKSKDKAHRNDKKYNRKTFTKNELIEMLTKK